MPRKARVLVPHCPHHIVQRGHNRRLVFLADEDYPFCLDNLAEWRARLGRIAANSSFFPKIKMKLTQPYFWVMT